MTILFETQRATGRAKPGFNLGFRCFSTVARKWQSKFKTPEPPKSKEILASPLFLSKR